MSNASPTFRGFRRQALYILYRLCHSSDDEVFAPETIEDLCILNKNLDLLEVIQVKDLKRPLSLTDLAPNQRDSFFTRAAAVIHSSPNSRLTVAHFGPIGPEFHQLRTGNETAANNLTTRIVSYGNVNVNDASRIISKLGFQQVSESELSNEILRILASSMTSVNVSLAINSLMFWIYVSSEKQQQLTRQSLLSQLHRITEFIGDVYSVRAEWLTNIVPLTNVHSLSIDSALKKEFAAGVSARYEHIVAGLDVVRDKWITSIANGFKESNIVILHAPSGMGKTALALRYMHEACSETCRFVVKDISDSTHSLRIARALSAHVSALQLPVTVLIDVPPRQSSWVQLARELAPYKSIRLLAVIRDEDWRAANTFGAAFDFVSVRLDFDKSEAKSFFEELKAQGSTNKYMLFDEAWSAFGSGGPLMEFLFLITQGGKLFERLSEQIHNIEDEIRRGLRPQQELDILRLVSVASAYNARVHARSLMQKYNFPTSGNPLRWLEDEYLVRSTEDGAYLEGLHPIRSKVLAELLCDSSTSDPSATVTELLPFIDVTQLELFAIHSLSEPAISDAFLATLTNFPVRTWTEARAICRSLLWRAVKDYCDLHREVISEARASGVEPFFALDVDIAGTKSEPPFSTVPSIWNSLLPFRNQQHPKHLIFETLRVWNGLNSISATPKTLDEWDAVAEVAFWLAKVGNAETLSKTFDWSLSTEELQQLPLEMSANVIIGLWTLFREDAKFLSWYSETRDMLIDKFRQESLSPTVKDEDDAVLARFVVRLDLQSVAGSNPWHEEAVWRLEILRRLFPDKERFGVEGVGHNILDEALEFDETSRPAVLRENIPIKWEVQLNRRFVALLEYEFRPPTWREYMTELVCAREAVVELLESVIHTVEHHFCQNSMLDTAELPLQTWQTLTRVIQNWLKFPKTVVDPFGDINESSSLADYGKNKRIFDQHIVLRKASHSYRFHMGNFGSQIVKAFQAAMIEGRLARQDKRKRDLLFDSLSIKPNSGKICLSNLLDARKELSRMQSAFREIFCGDEMPKWQTLEAKEATAFDSLIPSCWNLVYKPHLVLQNPIHRFQEAEIELICRFFGSARERMKRSASAHGYTVKICDDRLEYKGASAIWLLVDSDSSLKSFNSFESVFDCLSTAYRKSPSPEHLFSALRTQFDHILVVPLVRGCFVAPSAWVIPRYVLGDSTLSNIHRTLLTVDDECLNALGVQQWNTPLLALSIEYLRAVVEFAVTAKHISELNAFETLDEVGARILCDYVNVLGEGRGEYYQKALNAAGKLLDLYNEDITARSKISEDAVCHLMMWFEAARQPKPSVDGVLSLTLSETIDWAKSLSNAVPMAASAFLYLVDDALREVSVQTC